jgi:hypothetical protein
VLIESGNGRNEIHLVIDQRVTGGWIGNSVPVLQILASHWTHVAAVFSRSGMTLYLNGFQAGSNPEGLLSRVKNDSENTLGAGWGGNDSKARSMKCGFGR